MEAKTQKSNNAIENLKKYCEEELKNQSTVEIIDLLEYICYQAVFRTNWLKYCCTALSDMKPEQQVHEFLSKPFRSKNNHFEYNFYFTNNNKGLIEIINLPNDKVEFSHFEIEYTGIEPMMVVNDLLITIPTGEVSSGFSKPVSEALYFLIHKVVDIRHKINYA